MQRVHLKDSTNIVGGAEYLLADHLRELYLDFEGIEIVLADPISDDEASEYNRNPYRNETDDTFFVPFENIRAFDSDGDEFDGDVVAEDKKISFRNSVQMFGGATEITADTIIDRPPGVKVIKDDVKLIVPQNNISMMTVDDDALKQD